MNDGEVIGFIGMCFGLVLSPFVIQSLLSIQSSIFILLVIFIYFLTCLSMPLVGRILNE